MKSRGSGCIRETGHCSPHIAIPGGADPPINARLCDGFSVLDLMAESDSKTPADALRFAMHLAQHVEALGLRRS